MKNLYPFETYSSFLLGDMRVFFLKQQNDALQFTVIPEGTGEMIPPHRKNLNDTVGYRSNHLWCGNESDVAAEENIAQLHVMGDAFGYNALFRSGESVKKQKLVRQEKNAAGEIETVFSDERGIVFTQKISHREGEEFFVVRNSVRNTSGKNIEIGALESFTLGMLSPFHADDAPDSLFLHRYHSYWSAEGREEVLPVEAYELTCSWTGNYQRGFRFGESSSMIVQEYFPTMALEDRGKNVTWACELAAVTPWQMSVSRTGDFLTLAGGHPEIFTGNFRHTLRPGETFEGIPSVITCVLGDAQDALNRLSGYAVQRAEAHPAAEKDLPVIFNEYCSTWGNPSEENLIPVIGNLKDLGIRYFVMDAGWFRNLKTKKPGIGDWQIYENNYPHGFDALMDRARANGMIPGIWFEFECVSEFSDVYRNHPDWLVHFDGQLYRSTADRYFLDFRKKEVCDYLDERVIGFLKKHRLGYMKVDYNGKFHLADSGNGSAVDGTREVLESVRAFYLHLRKELPELTLEICSSGGFRLSGEWMRIGDMASFSDCHESVSVPLIAAQTALLIPFTANQVWATLRKDEEEKRTVWQLACGFLGRLCVSGDAAEFSVFQKDAVRRAVKLYQSCSDVMKNGKTRVEKHLLSGKYETPKGYQILKRVSGQGSVIVLHAFEDAPESVEIPVQGNQIEGELKYAGNAVLENGILKIRSIEPMSGCVFVVR